MIREMTELEKNKLKNVELELLNVIDDICEKNRLSYSLAFGTLLGAVRHRGYIPWDDDLDVMLPRDDYNKFVKCLKQDLPSDYYFVDAYSYSKYGLVFGKLMKKNTVFKETSINSNGAPNGIFIDVFPVDFTCSDKKLIRRQCTLARFIKKVLICRSKYEFNQGFIHTIIYRIKGNIYCLIPKRWLLYFYDKNSCKFSECKENGKAILLFETKNTDKKVFKREVFNKYIKLKFEDNYYSVISEYDEFLKVIYGEYMILPPKSQQTAHHFITELEFGE